MKYILLPHFPFDAVLEENIMSPAYPSDAGVDLYACEGHILEPGERALVRNGVSIEIDVGFEATVRPRSGLALKKGLTITNSPGTVDAGYRGEMCTILQNTSDKEVRIFRGDKVAQLVVSPIVEPQWERVESLVEAVRGDKGFGSSG